MKTNKYVEDLRSKSVAELNEELVMALIVFIMGLQFVCSLYNFVVKRMLYVVNNCNNDCLNRCGKKSEKSPYRQGSKR